MVEIHKLSGKSSSEELPEVVEIHKLSGNGARS